MMPRIFAVLLAVLAVVLGPHMLPVLSFALAVLTVAVFILTAVLALGPHLLVLIAFAVAVLAFAVVAVRVAVVAAEAGWGVQPRRRRFA